MRIWCGWHRVAAKFLVKFRSCWVVCDEISEKGSYFLTNTILNVYFTFNNCKAQFQLTKLCRTEICFYPGSETLICFVSDSLCCDKMYFQRRERQNSYFTYEDKEDIVGENKETKKRKAETAT